MRRHDTEMSAVAAACSQYLDGRYAEYLTGRGQMRPGWSWLNLPAHGTVDELRFAAVPSSGTAAGSWTEARAFLCGEILSMAATEHSLLEVQRAALVPLELQLMAETLTRLTEPAVLVQVTLAELDRHRQTIDGLW